MKLELKLYDKYNDWVEATWYTEADEVKTQVHCESFSGHPEHIAMFRAKVIEFGTPLSVDDELLIAEAISNFVMPTQAELDAYAQEQADIERRANITEQLLTMTVTTQSGKTFDANSQARLDISNGVLVSEAVGITETTWRLADNSEVVVTVTELKEALMLALTEYARIKGIGA